VKAEKDLETAIADLEALDEEVQSQIRMRRVLRRKLKKPKKPYASRRKNYQTSSLNSARRLPSLTRFVLQRLRCGTSSRRIRRSYQRIRND